uniref:Elongator complex protein 1 n=1 Tax=Onchocerca volvulus TaxID=6282 RepID=A0A8R1TX78_ONCVO
MRNLKIHSAIVCDTCLSSARNEVQRNEAVSDSLSSSEIEATCISVENRIFCACKAGICELSSNEFHLVEWTEQRNGGKIISFDHLSDEYLLCAVLSSGAVLIVDYENGTVERFDIVPVEICSARWAPDFHVLLLASSEMLYFITRQFDILNEQPLKSSRSGREELMTVGWGSKETQFQGIAGRKQLRKIDSEQQPTTVSECDQRRILLAWNGDANYVVISFVDNETDSRRFCVFDHEGELISHLQQISNVEETLTYRPTGNLIAVSRCDGDKREIVFYERNGQRRSKFELGPHQGTIINWMGWNTDGNILCVQTKNSAGTAQEVSFWCVSNYDWMLKYRILVNDEFLLACWHESNPNQFCYVMQSGRATFIEFDFTYNFCDGIVLSIAGSNVRVTDLKAASIPPPMCHYELTFPNTVCEVVQYNDTAVFLLADHSLLAYKLRKREFEEYAEYNTMDLPKNCICYNLYLSDSNRLCAIIASSRYNLYSLSLKMNREESICLYSTKKPFIWYSCITDGYILQGIDGEWFSVKQDKDKENCYQKTGKLFETESTLHCCNCSPTKDRIFGISKTNDLIVNGRSVLKYVGSYTMDQDYLLTVTFTSRSNSSELQIAELKDILTNDKEINYKTSRAIEKGAMLIGHEAGGTRVWLQMPRGNLETIHLKELLLNRLKELLNDLHFKDAAIMMKKHRIDMNLFYDHNPEANIPFKIKQLFIRRENGVLMELEVSKSLLRITVFFMKHIGQFIEDIGSAELLNLFVASLNNDNVTVDIYSENYGNSKHTELDKRAAKNGETKVQNVCTAIREYILNLDDTLITNLYTTVISTYLKEQPPQISKALSALREQSLKLSNGTELEKKWIAYVSLLVPNENLFNVALSTYDLNLALVVAQNSQMDPKEYLSLLTNFQAHSPPSYQKSKIDIYLGLFQRAIRNLSELDDCWDEAAEIIKRQNLYAEALAVYRGKKTYLKTCELCASHLMNKRRFEEAALLFKRANNIALALQCYQSAQNWKGIIECGQILDVEREVLNNLLQKMIPHFENKRNFMNIAKILSFMDKESNKAQIVEYYCKADAWEFAMNLAFGNEELIDIVSKMASIRCEQILQAIENWRNSLEQYCCRLEIVRQNKKNSLKAAVKRFEDQELSMSEVFSETSTTVSDISKISTASKISASARRRKHVEKKKKVLKEGTQYEDAALLNALKDIISLIDSQQDELILLLPTLVAVDAVEEARALQIQFLTLIKLAHKILGIAWPTYLFPHMIPGPLREIYRDECGIIRLPEENNMPSRIPLESELMRPQIRNVLWQLEICS